MNLLTLFFVSLGAATLLPGGSEALFVYELTRENNTLISLLLTASIGNTLGSCINFFLGKYASIWALEKNYMTQNTLEKSHQLFARYGIFALLLSWAPFIGDPLTFVAGVARYAWWKFLIVVAIAKTSRYTLIALGWQLF